MNVLIPNPERFGGPKDRLCPCGVPTDVAITETNAGMTDEPTLPTRNRRWHAEADAGSLTRSGRDAEVRLDTQPYGSIARAAVALPSLLAAVAWPLLRGVCLRHRSRA